MPMHSHDEKERGCPSPGGDAPQPNFRGVGPRNYVRPDDRIREEVCDLLTDASDIDASDIEVEVHRGQVTLTGTVRDHDTKYSAEEIAWWASGVKDVHNRLRVKGSRLARRPVAAAPS